MPGTDLNLDIPTLADTLTTIVSKTATALSVIETDLAGKITPSQINVNTALAMNGSAINNCGSVQLVAGNSPTTAGNIYYSAGEFFAIDATGVVQLTLNGAIDASSVGAISGMGGTTAAVTYDLATTQFRFTSNLGVWADLVARNVILESSGGGSLQLSAAAAITTTRQLNIDNLPTSGVVPLVFDAGSSKVTDGTVTRATGSAKFTIIDASSSILTDSFVATSFVTTPGYISLGKNLVHPDLVYVLPNHNGELINPSGFSVQKYDRFTLTQNNNGDCVWRQAIPIRNKQRLKKLTYKAASLTVTIFKVSNQVSTAVTTTSATAGGTTTLTVTSPTDCAGDLWVVEFKAVSGSGQGGTVSDVTVYIDSVTTT